MTRVVGVGAGGHARVLMDIARLDPSLDLVGMLDADSSRWGTMHGDVPILGGEELLESLLHEGRVDAAFIGVGGVPRNSHRRAVYNRVLDAGLRVVRLVHPRAIVARDVALGEGVMVMAGAILNPAAVLEDGVIVNTGAIVEHDCHIGAFAHICPGACLGGNVTIGEEAFVGLGARVIQGINVGARAIVGAGAVVIRDVPADTRVVGCPAR